MSSSTLIYGHTKVRTERITYIWSIERFDLLPQDVDEAICSPWFYSRDNSEKWKLELYPRGIRNISSDGNDLVVLYLARDSSRKSPITISTELKISKSNIILMNSSSTHQYGISKSWGCTGVIKRSELLSKNCFDNNKLIISCIIDIPVEVITSSFNAPNFDSKKNQLSDDFRLLLEDPIFSDFTIIVGDQKFPTHRYILARRSPVFAAMFEHQDLKENRKKEVRIENMEPDVIKGMLEFIYTDHVTNIKELSSGLLEAADKYDLEKLRMMCEKTLYEELNEKNAADVLKLADLHSADTLKKYVMKYIVDHAPELVKSNNWEKTGWNPELLLELFDQLALSQATNNEESKSSKV